MQDEPAGPPTAEDEAVAAAAGRLRASLSTGAGPGPGAAGSVAGITAGVAGLRMSTTDRGALRRSLAAGIKELKQKEASKALIADDPLLSC